MTIVRMRQLALAACMALLAIAGLARAEEVPVITGEEWAKSSVELKKAYLIGIANAFQVERAYHGTKAPTDEQSLIPRFARGLKGHTLDSVREGLDTWYAANPDRIKRPVIETIWFEMVIPGLKQNK